MIEEVEAAERAEAAQQHQVVLEQQLEDGRVKILAEHLKTQFSSIQPEFGDEDKLHFIANHLVRNLGMRDSQVAFDMVNRLKVGCGKHNPLDHVFDQVMSEQGIPREFER